MINSIQHACCRHAQARQAACAYHARASRPRGRPAWLTQSALFLSERPPLIHRGAVAQECPPALHGVPVPPAHAAAAGGVPLVRLTGADALEAAASLNRIRREDRFLKSSLDALSVPRPLGVHLPCLMALPHPMCWFCRAGLFGLAPWLCVCIQGPANCIDTHLGAEC